MSLSEAVLPDYEGANIANLMPALLQPPGLRPDWLPDLVRSAEQVVLLVADGLGWLQLQERTALAPRLASMTGGPITTVAPSTTACALTSLVVGGSPSDHGVVGYRLVVPGPSGDEVMNVLKWRTASGDARPFVDPGTFQSMLPFLGRSIPVVSKAEFAGTAFTEAHQRGARQVGWFQASGLAVEVSGLLSAGESLVYAYYDGVDKIAHIRGFGPHYDAELIALDRLVGDLIDLLPSGAVLAVTADHGQVDVGRRAAAIDGRVLAGVAMVSGEARFRWLHAKDRTPEGVEKLALVATEVYGDEAWVATCDQVEEDGWLGGPFRPEVRARVGDVAIVPFQPVAYLDEAEVGESKLMCRHGSLTAAEMLVPLIAHGGKMEW